VADVAGCKRCLPRGTDAGDFDVAKVDRLLGRSRLAASRAAGWSKARTRPWRSSSTARAKASSSWRLRRLAGSSSMPNRISKTVTAVVQIDSDAWPSSHKPTPASGFASYECGENVGVEDDHFLKTAGRAFRPRSSAMSSSSPMRAKRSLSRLPSVTGGAFLGSHGVAENVTDLFLYAVAMSIRGALKACLHPFFEIPDDELGHPSIERRGLAARAARRPCTA
jgi:hypothetical protein